jgi:hypothetical protein
VRSNALRRNVPSNRRPSPRVSIPGHATEAFDEERPMPESLQLQTLKALASAGSTGQYPGRTPHRGTPSNNTLT